MKKGILMFAGFLIIGISAPGYSGQGVAIQRVITNTRSELGQLASSSKAREITEFMKKFDAQYETWSNSCGGGENFDPNQASDACKAMASQMRETGILLYGRRNDCFLVFSATFLQFLFPYLNVACNPF